MTAPTPAAELRRRRGQTVAHGCRARSHAATR